MYSPRRRYYKRRSLKYYRNNLFAPSLKKAPLPNYYQMKGRIIQQSPAYIKNSDTQLMTQDKLQELYNTLVKFKYPMLPAFDPSGYLFYYVTEPYQLNTLGEEFDFDMTFFQTLVGSLEKPAPPSGYHYSFDVISILFRTTGYESQVDASRFNFNWETDLLTSRQLAIITKTLNSSELAAYTAILQAIPYQSEKCYVSRIAFTNSTMTLTNSLQNTTDENINDDGYYPFVTSDSSSETYGSKISYTRTVDDYRLHYYTIRFKLLIYVQAD